MHHILRLVHSKLKGNIGELVIATDLATLGYPVFRELGDSAKVDLIVLVKNLPVKVQVKAGYGSTDVMALCAKSSGPGYSYVYTLAEIDIFAGYEFASKTIIYVSAKELIEHGSMCFRLTPPIGHNQHAVRFASEYRSFDRVISTILSLSS